MPSRRWNSQNLRVSTASENLHLNPGSSWTRRGTRSSLNTGWCGSQKWLLVYYRRFHLPSSRGTQSQTVHAERRIISHSIEVHLRCHNNTYVSVLLEKILMISGTWMEKENCLMHGIWPDMWKHMSDAAKKKAKQRWAIEKPKLDNARQLRGILFIEPNDEKFKLTMKAARRKLEVPMPVAMPCKTPINSRGVPQYWEKQDQMCLYCWCRRKHETRACTQTSSRLHLYKRDEFIHWTRWWII